MAVMPARTAAGPPRMTVGMRKLMAPNSTCTPKPASNITVTVPISSSRPAATSHSIRASDATSHSRPAPMDIGANSRDAWPIAHRAR